MRNAGGKSLRKIVYFFTSIILICVFMTFYASIKLYRGKMFFFLLGWSFIGWIKIEGFLGGFLQGWEKTREI
jgi:hypothetical protein